MSLMEREFNTEGSCVPERHYTVDLGQKIEKIFLLIEKGKYFTINRPRQYGKTTVLFLLNRFLLEKEGYLPIRISFEGISSARYESESGFIEALLSLFRKVFLVQKNQKLVRFIEEQSDLCYLDQLGNWITELISIVGKKVILLIDEVDRSTNNQLFLDFLGMLRMKYLGQMDGEDLTFHSIILAGVHDVKNLKLRLHPKRTENSDEESLPILYNSPWNIAAHFDIKMSFSSNEILTMLLEYSQEKKVSMNLQEMAEKLEYYTSGYPFLVTRLCKLMDEKLMEEKLMEEKQDKEKKWDLNLLDLAVKSLLQEKNTNFQTLRKNLENHQELYQLIYDLLIDGTVISYDSGNPVIEMGETYGLLKNGERGLSVHNRIYQLLIYNHLSSKIEISKMKNPYDFQTNFVNSDQSLNFQQILLKFQEFMKSEYSKKDQKFLEQNGRLIFLAFLRPILNGKGFDFKEVQISEEKRLDIVVTYLNCRYVIELKIWHGEKAHQKGILQLWDYLERLNLTQGYLLVFDTTARKVKKWKQENIVIKGKEIFTVWA